MPFCLVRACRCVWYYMTSGCIIVTTHSRSMHAVLVLRRSLSFCASGGAIALSSSTGSADLTNVTLKSNTAATGGGLAVLHAELNVNVSDTIFESNSATSCSNALCMGGGAVLLLNSNANFVSCKMQSNSASGCTCGAGGAVSVRGSGTSKFDHCEMDSNRAPKGSGTPRAHSRIF